MKNNRKEEDDIVLPPITVGGRVKNGVKSIEKKLYKYDIFLIIVLSVLSSFVSDNVNYTNYIFPLLMYVVVYVLLRTIITKADRLKHCVRKKLAYKTISYYFLFGMFSIMFQIGNNVYSTVVNNGLLVLTMILLVLSMKNNK